ncbi:transglutaminaseTgpA domain-containing protein [Methylibium sp.]|uniref:transglutaminase family protein n=1 Tax=Methylibium sp. TaxID=2067992 RepID=UPI003D095B03
MSPSTAASNRWHWPGWSHLPREARDTLFLLAVIAWTVLPHVGQLPPWCTLLSAAVLLWRGALAVRSAALPNRWVLAGVLLLALALTFMTHRTLLGKESGITLLVVLVALKTLELRARRDAFAVFFLGFFLVLTHFLHSQSMAIAAAMLVSVWGLLTALVLAHMPVGQPSLRQAGGLAGRFALLGAPVMLLLFLLFPRIGPLWGVPNDAGAKTGLSGELRMGMIAELAADDSVAMRVRVLSGTPPAPQALYFRGPVLSRFDGETWHIGRSGFPSSSAPPAQNLRTFGEAVELEVTLEPSRLATIPALEATPELPPIDGIRTRLRDDLHWTANRPLTERVRYTARAWPRFTQGPTEPSVGLQDDLDLPAGFNPRTLEWAAALRREPRYAQADATTLATLLMQRIRTEGYSYTLAPGLYDEERRGTAIDEFWFDRKAGFCEHFATAFVVIMRVLDVPARVVTGYQGAERNPVDGTLVVRQSFAHAWAEYWQAGQGWVRADPTGAVAPERIDRSRPLAPAPGFVATAFGGVAPGALLQLRALWEATDNAWNQWVLNYSRGTQFDLLQHLGYRSPDWEDLALLLIGVATSLSLAAAGWAWWEHRRTDPWLRAYARVRRATAALGLDAHDGVPPRTLAAALRARHGAAAEPTLRALQALDRLRYARHDTPLSARRTAAQARRLAAAAVAALRPLKRPASPLPAVASAPR